MLPRGYVAKRRGNGRKDNGVGRPSHRQTGGGTILHLEDTVVAISTATLRDVKIAVEDADAAPVIVLDVLLRRFIGTVGSKISPQLDRRRRERRAQTIVVPGPVPSLLRLESALPAI
jgi:hypothetical protein